MMCFIAHEKDVHCAKLTKKIICEYSPAGVPPTLAD